MLLAVAYLAIPPGLTQPPGWSPRPDQAAKVAGLYRTHLGLGGIALISQDQLRLLNPLVLILAGVGYVGMLWSRPAGINRWAQAALCAPIALATLLMPPLYATDVFFYAMSGEAAARFGANPYLLTPSDFPTSNLLPFNYWTSITSPYGPIWTAVCQLTSWVSAADPFLTTLLLKAVACMAVIATGACIGLFLRASQPSAARFGAMLFLLNPFVWLTAVGDGHVDIIMAALMSAAAWLLARKRDSLGAWCAIAAATLVKYLTAPVLPLFFLARVRAATSPAHRARNAAPLVAAFAVMAALVWAPYWAGPRTVASLLEEGSRGYSAPPLVILRALGDATGVPDGLTELALNIGAAVMLAALMAWMLCALRRHTSATSVLNEVRSWALTLCAVAALLPRSHPWYLLSGTALLAAVHPKARRTTLVVYAAAAAWFFWRVAPI